MKKDSKIFVAGHRGLVGSAIVRRLKALGYHNLLLKNHKELDLINQKDVNDFFASEKPEYVFLAAAKVGGIEANRVANAAFLYENMMIEMNVIHAAVENGCKKLEFLGSNCIYPREAPQPIPENALLTSELEKTNEGYALAKISGLKLCEYLNRQGGLPYISLMPCNLYGPNDNYDPVNSHVLPGMIRRFHEAKMNNDEKVVCWGDGSAYREFLFSDDLATLCVLLMEKYDEPQLVNAGSGHEVTIRELAYLVADIIGFHGEIHWDTKMPNGTMRKFLDSSKANALGWKPQISLEDGIRMAYEDFLKQDTVHY